MSDEEQQELEACYVTIANLRVDCIKLRAERDALVTQRNEALAEAEREASHRRIADSECYQLRAARDSDFEVFHAIRVKLTKACGDAYKLHDEALDAIIAERDKLRARVAELEQVLKGFSRLGLNPCGGGGMLDPYHDGVKATEDRVRRLASAAIDAASADRKAAAQFFRDQVAAKEAKP